MVESPSDLGYPAEGFNLPPLTYHDHVVDTQLQPQNGELFILEAQTLTDRRRARKESINDRVALTASLVNNCDEQWIVWCDLNDEGNALTSAIAGAVQVAGSDSPEHKESSMVKFANGEIRVLVSKPSICGFGMNFQSCHNMAFVGMSDSFEAFYQAVRRCWRFGQEKEVNVHIISASSEGAVIRNIKRKESDAEKMIAEMTKHLSVFHSFDQQKRDVDMFSLNSESGNGWQAILGDCVESVSNMADDSIDYSIFSPPFASLYTYSNSERDMGNARTGDEFAEHFQFLAKQLFRVIRPGRLLSFHCMNIPMTKERHGVIGIHDFRGELIRIFQSEGFIFHSEVCIWKDPVVQMQRTKSIGLLYKQLRKDSCMSRQGIPDYLVTMRKPGDNAVAVTKNADDFSVDLWQNYASPVWMDINPSKTLQRESAREEKDERHICPLQLEVIERAIQLWTNPDDLVLSPFMGIGSEGHVALKMGRRFVGTELKKSYWDQAVANLRIADSDDSHQPSLFQIA